MSHLVIRLFGAFRTELDGITLTAFRTNKNRALLAYLALESDRSQRRETLAALFWPDQPETKAHNSLRQSLYLLRQVLSAGMEHENHLLISPYEVQLNPDADHWIDVVEFKKILGACKIHQLSGSGLCPACLEHIYRALELYQGELLTGFSLQGCNQFDDWQVCAQEDFHNCAVSLLSLLVEHYQAAKAYDQVVFYAQKVIEMEPWHEPAHRRKMMALAIQGQHGRSLQQYATLCKRLQQDLATHPTEETQLLYEQIRNNFIPPANDTKRVAWFTSSEPVPSQAVFAPFFAGRMPELGRLFGYLEEVLAGRGRAAFICGEAGIGKTALMDEFALRAIEAYPSLLVAKGSCSTFSGIGVPFQPFREVLGTLAGICDSPSTLAAASAEHPRRLSAALPVILLTLLETSPGLAGSLIPALDLVKSIAEAVPFSDGNAVRLESWLSSLTAFMPPEGRQSLTYLGDSETSFSRQEDLIDQSARFLLRLSQRYPLLILLDDLQWSDPSSASLFFHLGQRLSGGQLLILGAYRSEEIQTTLTGEHERHSIAGLINEFQRRFGQVRVDLAGSDNRAFLDDLLDSAPNHLDMGFREKLYLYSGGNALFMVELLRLFHQRGDLFVDKNGQWIEGHELDWELLPWKVEGVIAERLGRLEGPCLAFLEAASVQGEVFFTQVLAQVLGFSEVEIIHCLSGPLSKQHGLVSCGTYMSKNGSQKACYRFRHILYQKYLYQRLDEVERTRLQQATAEARLRT